MNRTLVAVLLGMVLTFVFAFLGDALARALGHMPINGALIFFASVFLGFLVSTMMVQPTKKQ